MSFFKSNSVQFVRHARSQRHVKFKSGFLSFSFIKYMHITDLFKLVKCKMSYIFVNY